MINLALVGVGVWGKNYIETVEKMPNVKIKYVCAFTDKTLNSLNNKYIKLKNYLDLLKFNDIDGVIIATPNNTHFKISKDLIQKFNLLIEKPLVENYKNAEKLKSFQDKYNHKIMVGHIYLFDPAFIKVKELSKKINNLRYVFYEANNNGPIREGTSALWDIGPHAISNCLELFDEMPKSVCAWGLNTTRKGNKFDFLIIRITFKNDIEAHIKINWIYPYKKRELIIVGKKDSIVYSDMEFKKIKFYKNSIPDEFNTNDSISKSYIIYPKYSTISPLENEIYEFLKLIDGKKIKSDINFGISVTKILTFIEQSALKNGKELIIS